MHKETIILLKLLAISLFSNGYAHSQERCDLDEVIAGNLNVVAALSCLALEIKLEQMPSGSVVAFARDCPTEKGWKPFLPATSRFVIGAGDDFENSLENWMKQQPDGSHERVPLTVRELNSTGGEEAHVLSNKEMPRHNHQMPQDSTNSKASMQSLMNSPGDDEGIPSDAQKTTNSGEGKPHNNMPPFIALHYCEKE